MDGTDDVLWYSGEVDGIVRSDCEKMKALPVKMETVILIGKDRQNLTCFL